MAEARQSILSAEKKLETAYFGLKDMLAGPERYDAGLMNAVVFGRMVTLSLQNMSTSVPRFAEWYKPHRENLAADPLMRFFVTMRNEIEKQVKDHKSAHVFISNVDQSLFDQLGDPPPGATSFFMGDEFGRSGWNIQQPDGEVDRYYVVLPAGILDHKICLRDTPPEFAHVQASDLVAIYLGKLGEVVKAARQEFWK